MLDGNAQSSIFRVTKTTTATLADLTIQNGIAVNGGTFTSDGGGIYNDGTLTINDSTLSGNSATANFGQGGGILNSGTLTLNGTALTGNSAAYGGAIYNSSSAALIINSTIAGNTGTSAAGCICNNILTTSLTIRNSRSLTTATARFSARCPAAEFDHRRHDRRRVCAGGFQQ